MSSSHKRHLKSYREANTVMRAQFDAMQAAVVNKVDEVVASFRQEKPHPHPRPKPLTKKSKRTDADYSLHILAVLLICLGLIIAFSWPRPSDTPPPRMTTINTELQLDTELSLPPTNKKPR